MTPPSASISRTRCPFAVPPIAGLHGMCATVSLVSVHNPTWTPIRAAAYAASQPAWPAPITMTSNSRLFTARSFSYAEPREDVGEQFVAGATAADLFERRACVGEIRQDEFLRERRIGADRVARAGEGAMRAVHQPDVPDVRDCRAVALPLDVERASDRAAQHVDAGAGRRRDGDRRTVRPRCREISLVRDVNHFAKPCTLFI